MVQVQVNIAEGVHKLTWFEPHNLRDHHGEQCIRRNVERHPKEGVGAALIQLAIQLALGNMKLEQTMTRRQGHVVNETGVPGTDDMSAAVRICLELFNELYNLVGGRPIRVGP